MGNNKIDYKEELASLLNVIDKETDVFIKRNTKAIKSEYGTGSPSVNEIVNRLYDKDKAATPVTQIEAALGITVFLTDYKHWKKMPLPFLMYNIGLFRAILYSSDDEKSSRTIQKRDIIKPPINNEIREIIKESETEIKDIYSALKTVGFSTYIIDRENKLKKVALRRFDDSRKGFKYIKRNHLEDFNLYSLNTSKEKRDFQGFLLQKIICDQGFKSYGAQMLYSELQKIRREQKEIEKSGIA